MKRRLILAAVAAFFIASTWGLLANQSHAVSTPTWDWSTFSVLSVRDGVTNPPICGVGQIYTVIQRTPTYVCERWQNMANGLRLGSFNDYSGWRIGVRFAPSETVYPLENISYDSVVGYSSSTDTLIVKTSNGQLMAYDHFTERLHRDGEQVSVDTADPIYQAPVGRTVGTVALSDNQEWMVFEVIDNGSVVVHLTDGTFRHFATVSGPHGPGYNTTLALAITNDGETVAIGGVGTPSRLYHTVHCGDTTFDATPDDCESVDDSNWQAPAGDWNTAYLAFNSSGTELSFIGVSASNAKKTVTLAASDDVHGHVDYLALGDSFTSGEGETDDSYYVAGTNTADEKCHVSTRSYPFLVGAAIGMSNTKSVACSGATIGDVINDSASYKGQSGRLADDSAASRATKQKAAVQQFIPGHLPQSVFVESYSPDVLTVGIGGNDAGLFGKLRACAMPDECEWVAPKGRAETAKELASLYGKLVAAYSKVQALSPSSKLYAVDYPNVINADGQCGAIGALFDHDERQLMSEGIHYLDQVVKAAAASVGIPVLDVENAFTGHAICDDGLAMNTLRIGNDSELISGLDWTKVIANETFHPTPYGHQLLAAAIMRSVPNISTYVSPCGATVCPNDQAAVPTPDAWLAGDSTNIPISHQAALTSDTAYKNSPMTVTIPAGEFAPNSTVSVSIHSDDTPLQQEVVGTDGSTQFNVDLPSDLDPGSHTVHVGGTNEVGDPVDAYQVITYTDQPQPTAATGTPDTPSGDTSGVPSFIQTLSQELGGGMKANGAVAQTKDQEVANADAARNAADTTAPAAVLGDAITDLPQELGKIKTVAPRLAKLTHNVPLLAWIILGALGVVAVLVWVLLLRKTKNFR